LVPAFAGSSPADPAKRKFPYFCDNASACTEGQSSVFAGQVVTRSDFPDKRFDFTKIV
jgi:hypothetical protein